MDQGAVPKKELFALFFNIICMDVYRLCFQVVALKRASKDVTVKQFRRVADEMRKATEDGLESMIGYIGVAVNLATLEPVLVVEAGTLTLSFLFKNQSVGRNDIQRLSFQVLLALVERHALGVSSQHLRPHDIILVEDGKKMVPKLTGSYVSSKEVEMDMVPVHVWSCILLFMATGSLAVFDLLEDGRYQQQVNDIQHFLSLVEAGSAKQQQVYEDAKERLGKEGMEVLKAALVERESLEKLLLKPWYANLRWGMYEDAYKPKIASLRERSKVMHELMESWSRHFV